MSDPTPSRRFALLLVLTVAIGITNCIPHRMKGRPQVSMTLCDRGNGSPTRPLICVDERTMLTSPPTAYIYDLQPDDQNKPSNRPVVIHWLARQGGNLGVEFADKNCTEQVRCDGAGHCWTRVKKLREGETLNGRAGRRCQYSLNLDGRASDPPIIVNPCCWAIDDVVPTLDTNVDTGFIPKY